MKKFRVKVNGKIYEVEVEEVGESSTSQSVSKSVTSEVPKAKPISEPKPKKVETPKPKPKPASSEGGEEIKAPMPGKILEVRKKEGESVNEGDVLIILEAMKMENEIMAPISGTVRSVYVNPGQMVETDDLLVIIE